MCNNGVQSLCRFSGQQPEMIPGGIQMRNTPTSAVAKKQLLKLKMAMNPQNGASFNEKQYYKSLRIIKILIFNLFNNIYRTSIHHYL